MLSLFLGTGIRVSECVGLNIEDIDFSQNAFLDYAKGRQSGRALFPTGSSRRASSLLGATGAHRCASRHENALFLSLQRKRMNQRSIQNLVKKYAAYAAPLKPRISPHKLRSTFGTNLYHATGDIYLVADVLGHTSVDTTRKHLC